MIKASSHCTLNSLEPVSHSALPARSAAQRKWLRQYLPELLSLESLVRAYPDILKHNLEATIDCHEHRLPIYSLTLGAESNSAPCFFVCAGMHGVERIGSQVVLSWLKSLLVRLSWDKSVVQLLSEVRIVCLPIINPVGMSTNRRCNHRGVDLNRNAPLDAEASVPFLAGGHRLGRFLPWYRGAKDNGLELEAQVLEAVFEREILPRPQSIALDLHSGFGFQDSLWFPYAYTPRPIDCIDDYMALNLLWQRNYPQQMYRVEPQAKQYLSHGDLWDYLYKRHSNEGLAGADRVFLPLTLEMGSWNWVKKNPLQLFKPAGLFHPIKSHRKDRVLRRHQLLFDFLMAALVNMDQWLPEGRDKSRLDELAHQLWFKAKK